MLPRSVTSARPSGRNATPQGIRRPDATISTAGSGVRAKVDSGAVVGVVQAVRAQTQRMLIISRAALCMAISCGRGISGGRREAGQIIDDVLVAFVASKSQRRRILDFLGGVAGLEEIAGGGGGIGAGCNERLHRGEVPRKGGRVQRRTVKVAVEIETDGGEKGDGVGTVQARGAPWQIVVSGAAFHESRIVGQQPFGRLAIRCQARSRELFYRVELRWTSPGSGEEPLSFEVAAECGEFA